mgnify:CR=1 FL=1
MCHIVLCLSHADGGRALHETGAAPGSAHAATLAARGAEVRVHDPWAGENVRRTNPELQVADSVEDCLARAEIVLVLLKCPSETNRPTRSTAPAATSSGR